MAVVVKMIMMSMMYQDIHEYEKKRRVQSCNQYEKQIGPNKNMRVSLMIASSKRETATYYKQYHTRAHNQASAVDENNE